MRRLVAATALLVAAAAGTAGAHSVNDLLKVPVGQQASLLMPPLSLSAGHQEVRLVVADGFSLTSAGAGPGWVATVTKSAVVVEGTAHGEPLVVTVTGVARRPGPFPVEVYLNDAARPAYGYTITALNNYMRQPASADAAKPDAPVQLTAHRASRQWAFSAVLAVLALGVLLFGGKVGHLRRGSGTLKT